MRRTALALLAMAAASEGAAAPSRARVRSSRAARGEVMEGRGAKVAAAHGDTQRAVLMGTATAPASGGEQQRGAGKIEDPFWGWMPKLTHHSGFPWDAKKKAEEEVAEAAGPQQGSGGGVEDVPHGQPHRHPQAAEESVGAADDAWRNGRNEEEEEEEEELEEEEGDLVIDTTKGGGGGGGGGVGGEVAARRPKAAVPASRWKSDDVIEAGRGWGNVGRRGGGRGNGRGAGDGGSWYEDDHGYDHGHDRYDGVEGGSAVPVGGSGARGRRRATSSRGFMEAGDGGGDPYGDDEIEALERENEAMREYVEEAKGWQRGAGDRERWGGGSGYGGSNGDVEGRRAVGGGRGWRGGQYPRHHDVRPARGMREGAREGGWGFQESRRESERQAVGRGGSGGGAGANGRSPRGAMQRGAGGQIEVGDGAGGDGRRIGVGTGAREGSWRGAGRGGIIPSDDELDEMESDNARIARWIELKRKNLELKT